MGLRTPEQFRKSLRDGRIVFFKGRRVEDVTTHPVLKIGVDSSAVDYELSENSEWTDLAVAADSPEGERYSRFFLPPRSPADLLRRRKLCEVGSRICFGFPPFCKEGGSGARSE